MLHFVERINRLFLWWPTSDYLKLKIIRQAQSIQHFFSTSQLTPRVINVLHLWMPCWSVWSIIKAIISKAINALFKYSFTKLRNFPATEWQWDTTNNLLIKSTAASCSQYKFAEEERMLILFTHSINFSFTSNILFQ